MITILVPQVAHWMIVVAVDHHLAIKSRKFVGVTLQQVRFSWGHAQANGHVWLPLASLTMWDAMGLTQPLSVHHVLKHFAREVGRRNHVCNPWRICCRVP